MSIYLERSLCNHWIRVRIYKREDLLGILLLDIIGPSMQKVWKVSENDTTC